MRAIDTNVLVRLVVRDDERQTAAADQYVAGGAWISHLVLAEFTWVLDSVYGVSAISIANTIEMLLNHDQLWVQDGDVVQAAVRTLQAKPALGFSDCLILETARKAGHIPLGTFDRSLSKQPGAARL